MGCTEKEKERTQTLFHSYTCGDFHFVRYTPYVEGLERAVSAAPRAPPISSFKIILRPKGHSPLSYPLRQITLARRVAPTVISLLEPTTESCKLANGGKGSGVRAEARGEPRATKRTRR